MGRLLEVLQYYAQDSKNTYDISSELKKPTVKHAE